MSVEGNQACGPEGVDSVCAEDNVSVVCFVVMADPASDESPEGLDAWVGTPSSDFLWLATYC